MRDLSRAFAVASLACLVAACSFTSSGSGGPGSEAVSSTSSTIPTGGHQSSPGQVDCNGASATSSTFCSPSGPQGACCSSGTGAGTCEASTSTTCGGGGQWLFQCDEAADCGAGQICCLTGNVFSCQTSCSPQQQSCRLNSECGQSAQCFVQDCQGTFTELCSAQGNGCSSL